MREVRERVIDRKEGVKGGKGYVIRERGHMMLDRINYIVGAISIE